MNEQALRLAAAVLDGEDPKAFFIKHRERDLPKVVISAGSLGKFTVPVYSTWQGQFTNYGYTSKHLTPEQRRFLEDHWEQIEFNAVEGDRVGVFSDAQTGRRTGGWRAIGDWNYIPLGKWPPRDYPVLQQSGLGEMIPDPEGELE
jgi:hypothetical protein